MPQKVCIEPRCGNDVAANSRGRCAVHARDRDRTINRAGRAVYNTKRWKLLRRHKLFLDPLCETGGCREIATDVHHRVDIADGGEPWSMENLAAHCHTCHSRLTRREQMERVA